MTKSCRWKLVLCSEAVFPPALATTVCVVLSHIVPSSLVDSDCHGLMAASGASVNLPQPQRCVSNLLC